MEVMAYPWLSQGSDGGFPQGILVSHGCFAQVGGALPTTGHQPGDLQDAFSQAISLRPRQVIDVVAEISH